MVRDTLNDADRALFHSSVGNVKRIIDDRAETRKPAPPAVPQQLQLDEQQAVADLLSDHYDPAQLNLSEAVSFQRPGIQHSVMRKLRRSQYRICAELDLHGLIVVEARQALVTFLHQAKTQQHRCVRIIHGKGRRSSNKGPVLKPLVAHWLTQRDEVLAFCTAPPNGGGTGAVDVLLKNR